MVKFPTTSLEPRRGFLFFGLQLQHIWLYNDIPFQFYYKLVSWWSEFHQTFTTEKDLTNTIWNNCEIRIDNKPIYYKTITKLELYAPKMFCLI